MERKITINIQDDDTHNFKPAIGHLALWAFTAYDTVDINSYNCGELRAVYTQSDTPGKVFVIGAVRDEKGEYTFHS